jgi:hypothetical protein
MDSQIEKMNRLRKNILWNILIGTVAAFGIFMYPALISIYLEIRAGWLYRILPGALLLWSLLNLVLLLRPWIDKRRSRPSPSARSRKRISTGLAVVSFLTLFGLIHFTIGRFFGYSARSYRYMDLGLLSWFALCLIMLAVYWRYRHVLKKDPLLRSAVNDERIRENWLKAYRFGFFMTCGIAFIWKWYESSLVPLFLARRLMLPDGPWLIFFGALISLVGSFLYYNREARDE